jgi:uncharacterized 2Fe-2S/4Fe-4S cluster protein (DUF4445 family)
MNFGCQAGGFSIPPPSAILNVRRKQNVMKTTKQIKEKEFDTVKTFREIKEKISKDIYGMTLPQIQEYLRQQKLKASEK